MLYISIVAMIAACDSLARARSELADAKYSPLPAEAMRVSRDNGRERRSLTIARLEAGSRRVTIDAVGDSTVFFTVDRGNGDIGMASALSDHACRWADSTRAWLATPMRAVTGAAVDETRRLMPSDRRESGYNLDVSRAGAGDSLRYSANIWADGVNNGATVHFFHIDQSTLDAFLAGICAAADSSKQLTKR